MVNQSARAMVLDSKGDSNNECNEIVPSVSFEPGTNLYGLNAFSTSLGGR